VRWRRKLKILPTHRRHVLTNALFNDDERLRVLLEAWAELPERVKDAVLEMVRG
jgi:hypothetical protein